MAKKATFNVIIDNEPKEMNGYEFNTTLGLVLHDGFWKTIHLPTGISIAGKKPKGYFKQKNQCLDFIEKLWQEKIDWNFKTFDEAFVKNPEFKAIYERVVGGLG